MTASDSPADVLAITSSWQYDARQMAKSMNVIRTSDKANSSSLTFEPGRVSLETCTQLVRRPSAEVDSADYPCTMTLSTKNPTLLRLMGVLLVSDCQRVEVYRTETGEYISTVSGTLVDDDEATDPEAQVFQVRIDFSRLDVSSCCLKLTGLSSGSCWILALSASIGERSPTPPGPWSSRTFDMNAVEALIKDVQLSDRAKAFKSLLGHFQESKPSPASLSMLRLLPTSKAVLDRTKCPSNLPVMDEEVSAYASCQCQRMLPEIEKRLNEKIECIEKTLNEKLDNILLLLHDRANLKPS